MIDFSAGTYQGQGTLDKLTTYRDGGLSIPIKVNSGPEAAVLLLNINKICRVTIVIDDKKAEAQGELVKLSTLRKGQINLDFALTNEPKTGGFFLANVKKAGALTVEFSSVSGKVETAEEDEDDDNEGQVALDFMSGAAEDGKPVEGVKATDKPEAEEA